MDWLNISLKLPITDPTWIFLLVLLIILFAPMLLNKLRIPHIIGMILAVVLIVLLFTDKFFNGRQCVYAFTVGFTFVMALINGLETANIKFDALESFLVNYVPMHTLGLSWIWFAAAGYIIGLLWMKLSPQKIG